MKRAPLDKIPDHLLPYIAKQDPSLYTPIDHASWRFILKISQAFFAKNAHQKYLDGLRETGTSTERIPLIEEMDQCLKRFGWRAVAVSGFIPPGVFMEFQSLGILPIACEMRTLEHLAYTPAPDIVHEAAGHAPILADPEYAEYLRAYGEVARKAIFSHKDMEIYEAVRMLSDIKENPASTKEEVGACQKRLDDAIATSTYVSEATYLARMNWWTVEYGLVGDLSAPKIYGAGLLSSVGESYHCLADHVLKIPFTLDCLNTSYDITRPQPQLFVTPDFHCLKQVLEEVSSTMGYRRGGVEGLAKAKMAQTVTTTTLDTGVQISGILTDFSMDSTGQPVFLKYRGPVQLAEQDREIKDQGPAHHKEGFSSPIGRLSGMPGTAADLKASDLEMLGFQGSSQGHLRFESGIELEGVLIGSTEKDGKNLILSFKDCTVRRGEQILFLPEWGTFDMVCGAKVVSVFGGAADRGSYRAATELEKPTPQKSKSNLTDANRELNALYARVRKIREEAKGKTRLGSEALKELDSIHSKLESAYPGDWLLRYELLELNARFGANAYWEEIVLASLNEIAKTGADKMEMIARGMRLL